MLTVQNTERVSRIEILGTDLIQQQFDAVVTDLAPSAVKTEL